MLNLVGYGKIEPTVFPDGTRQVWKILEKFGTSVPAAHNEALIYWVYESDSELIDLYQLSLLLRRYGFEKQKLHINYLPYGRQDKEVDDQATFGLHAFANILNAMKFTEVSVLDPHSWVALKLINNITDIFPEVMFKSSLLSCKANMVAFPDKGATSKYFGGKKRGVYHEILNTCMDTVDVVTGNKVRDQLTGNITSYEIDGNNPKGKTVLMIDDICDGGATFVAMADKLYAAGAKEVHLFVSHGIFSKGIEVLRRAGIKRIFSKSGEEVRVDFKV